jgi:fructose-bisphosphate aldolase class 1
MLYPYQVPLSVRMVSQTTVLKSVLKTQTLELTTAAVRKDTRSIALIAHFVMVISSPEFVYKRVYNVILYKITLNKLIRDTSVLNFVYLVAFICNV